MIGAGSYGRVFMGLNMDTGSLIAIKELVFSRDNEKEVNAAEDYISAITNGSEQKPISFPYDNSNGSPHPCLMSL